MKTLIIILAVVSLAAFASCDVQSGITKKSVEDYQPTPTPTLAPKPAEVPIDPADVVTVDTSVQGPKISVDGPNETQTVTCSKYNRVMVNSNENVVTIKGACEQIMINGSRNEVTADAVAEIVVNGGENVVKYSRYVNGKQPVVKESRPGNQIERVAATPSAPSKKS